MSRQNPYTNKSRRIHSAQFSTRCRWLHPTGVPCPGKPQGRASGLVPGTAACRLGADCTLQGHRDGAGAGGPNRASQFSQPQAGKDHGAKRSGPHPGNEVFALLDKTGTGQCLVAVTGTSLSTAGVFVFARPAPAPPPTWPGPALAVLVATSTAVLPATSAVEGGQPERPCLVASGEASGSECLRRPPQIRPQPTHPVRQNTAWHTEVNGDVGVRLATPPHLRPLGATSRCLQCRCVSYFIYFISVFLQDTRWYGTELGEPYVPMEEDHDHRYPRTASSRVTSIPFITSYVMRLVPRWPFLTRYWAVFVELARASDVRSGDHGHPAIGRPL